MVQFLQHLAKSGYIHPNRFTNSSLSQTDLHCGGHTPTIRQNGFHHHKMFCVLSTKWDRRFNTLQVLVDAIFDHPTHCLPPVPPKPGHFISNHFDPIKWFEYLCCLQRILSLLFQQLQNRLKQFLDYILGHQYSPCNRLLILFIKI